MPAFNDAVAEPVCAHASRADGSQKSRCCGLPDIVAVSAFDGAGGGNRTHGLGIMRTVPSYDWF